jgi:hypothetical protein
MRGSLIRLEGRRFGALVVLRREGRRAHSATWLCQCDCGQQVVSRSDRLRLGRQKACGLNGHKWYKHLPRAVSSTHRSENKSWRSMHERCKNQHCHNYNRYGGRGIKICPAWDKFEVFLKDMGPKPTPKHTIERIDNDGNYEPGNCCWATRKEQTRNTGRTITVKYEGEKILLIDLIEKLGLNNYVVRSRLQLGWTLADAMQIPVRRHKKHHRSSKPKQALPALTGSC